MPYTRYCPIDGRNVTCREERHAIPGTYERYSVTLFCPRCERRLGEIYSQL